MFKVFVSFFYNFSFRSPDPVTFPRPPGRPEVGDRGPTYLTLAWQRNLNSGASQLIGRIYVDTAVRNRKEEGGGRSFDKNII